MIPERPSARFCVALPLLLLGLFTGGCRSVSVHGVIETPQQLPIAQASVTLRSEQPGAHAVSGSSEPTGCFNLFETIPRNHGDYHLFVESPGYKPVSVPIAPRLDNLLVVTLVPETSAASSTIRPISSSERYIRYATPCEPLVNANSISLH